MDQRSKINEESSHSTRALRWIVDLFYRGAITRFVAIDVWRWAVCGFGNYIVLDSLLYYAIYHYIVAERFIDFGIVVVSPHILSLIILFPITFLSGFWLNRNVAFRATHEIARDQLWRYLMTIGGSFLLNYTLMKVLVEVCGVWATPSKIIGSVITSLYSFVVMRFFTFRRKNHRR